MSLYDCLDFIAEEENKLRKQENASWFFKQLRRLTNREHNLPKYQDLLLMLKESFEDRINNDDYRHLAVEIHDIEQYIILNKIKNIGILHYILDDLYAIERRKIYYESWRAPIDAPPLTNHRICNIRQSRSYRLGNSLGMCYGVAMAMADPEESPFLNQRKQVFDLDGRVHRYQKDQLHRHLDQGLVKRTRLTREYFCPDASKQADACYQLAKTHSGKDLIIHLRSSIGSHAVYLKVAGKKILYADANYGAYSFPSLEAFKQYYIAASNLGKQYGIDYRFYAMSEIRYGAAAESRTAKGVLRTILKGSKYKDNDRFAQVFNEMLHAVLGIALGFVIALMVPSTSVFSFFSLPIIGGMIGFHLLGLATEARHFGLLAVPHLIQDSWYTLSQKLRKIAANVFNNPPRVENVDTVSLGNADNRLAENANNLPMSITEKLMTLDRARAEIVNLSNKTEGSSTSKNCFPETFSEMKISLRNSATRIEQGRFFQKAPLDVAQETWSNGFSAHKK